MVDVLSAGMQQLCARWETQRYSASLRKQPLRVRTNDPRSMNDRLLFNIKETEWTPLPEKKQRPFMGLSCSSCTPSSRSANVDKNYRNVSVVDVVQTEALKNPPRSIIAKIFPHLCQAFSFKKFHYPYIYESVLQDETVKHAVEEAARRALNDQSADASSPEFVTMLKSQQERAAKVLKGLSSTFSDFILRIASFVMNKVFGRLFSRIIVHPSQIEMLQRASQTQVPLIFLPLHRSHIDYIVITYITSNNNIRSPIVAAGENLRIPVFGWLLRCMGAFFIKRRIDPSKGKKDILYRALLQTYMMHCLNAGYNFEFFIEGGRTRTGKPCMPKGGLLSVFVDAYIEGSIEDALLVPVSINYERIVDGNFVREQLGQPKEMESFSKAISSIWTALTSYYGIVRVDFNQPFSLRELVSTFQSKSGPRVNRKKILHSVPSTASLYGTDIMVEEHRQLVDSIARHIIYDCSRSTAVMSTNAVSFLLLSAFRDGTRLETLAEALDKLREQLNFTDRDCGFVGDSIDVVNHAVDILGPGLVKRERNSSGEVTLVPVTMLPNVLELQYYSNCLIPHFILEAVIGTCIKCLVRQSGADVVYRGNLMNKCKDLCEIMQFEFIFTKTCQTLDRALDEVIESFLATNILIPQEEEQLIEEQEWAKRFSKHIDNNSDSEEECNSVQNLRQQMGAEYKVKADHELQRLYSVLLQPFIDSYVTTALNLYRLEKGQLTEKDLTDDVLDDIRTKLTCGDLSYNESASLDTIRNALKLFEKWDVIECHTEARLKIYYLSQEYENSGTKDPLAPTVTFLREFQ